MKYIGHVYTEEYIEAVSDNRKSLWFISCSINHKWKVLKLVFDIAQLHNTWSTMVVSYKLYFEWLHSLSCWAHPTTDWYFQVTARRRFDLELHGCSPEMTYVLIVECESFFVNSDDISHCELEYYIREALFCICLFDGPWDELYDENEIYN